MTDDSYHGKKLGRMLKNVEIELPRGGCMSWPEHKILLGLAEATGSVVCCYYYMVPVTSFSF